MYSIKEMFYSLQGEGAQQGRPAVFCRFSGCNLWSGRELDRHKAQCHFCDTDFVGTNGQNGGKFADADSLATALWQLWPTELTDRAYVVCTGGEPLLQLDEGLIKALKQCGFQVAVETNGTLSAPAGIDWLCISPKADCDLKIWRGDELKLIYPQAENKPEDFVDLNFQHFFLQALDDDDYLENRQHTLDYCLAQPQWRFGLQLHKILKID